jgi:hypothetical protein
MTLQGVLLMMTLDWMKTHLEVHHFQYFSPLMLSWCTVVFTWLLGLLTPKYTKFVRFMLCLCFYLIPLHSFKLVIQSGFVIDLW